MRLAIRPHHHGLGISRKEFLQVGFSGLLGLHVGHLRAGTAAAAQAAAPGRAKSVILVFCTGAPAHQDIWDLKPSGTGRGTRRVSAR